MGGQGWSGNARAPKSAYYCSLMACPMATPRAGGKLKVKRGAGERHSRGAYFPCDGSEGWQCVRGCRSSARECWLAELWEAFLESKLQGRAQSCSGV